MLMPEGNKPGGIFQQVFFAVIPMPVKPGDLIILAVSIVVAVLGTADLVTTLDHRYALREDQSSQEVPFLLFAQIQDI